MILLTRPAHQQTALKTALIENGFDVLTLPCLHIEPIDYASPLITSNDIVIFTSQNAVFCCQKNNIPCVPTNSFVIAIGPATQVALKEKKIKALIPTQFNSEGLLNLKALQSVRDRSIFIFCGENPRPLLADTLKQRGAHVQVIPCYRRQCPFYTDAELQKLMQHPIECIVSTSPDSLNNLNTLFSHHTAWLHQQNLLVVSEKMQKQARSLGFHRAISRAKAATNEAIVEALLGERD